MKTTLLLAALAGASLPVLAACANASHATEAGDLRDRVAALPGVASATLDYTAPVTLDSGKLQLTVAMDADPDPDALVDVVTTTYAAFADTHHGEEGDLDITWGSDIVHLRSFEPDAKPAAVRDAIQAALPVLEHESVRVDLNTQDVTERPHVRTRFTVTTAGTDADALVAALPALDQRFGRIANADWTIETGPWTLASTGGIAGPEQVALFGRLRDGLPKGASIWLGDDAATSLTLPAGTTPEAAAAVADRQLALLGGSSRASYDLMVGDSLDVTMIDGECFFDPDPVGTLVKKHHGSDCRTIDGASR